jgi:hypothetical protein
MIRRVFPGAADFLRAAEKRPNGRGALERKAAIPAAAQR